MSGNHFLKTDLALAGGNHFLASGNHFLPLSQIFFKKFFFPTTGTRFFMPEEKYCFLLRTLFTAGGNHYLN